MTRRPIFREKIAIHETQNPYRARRCRSLDRCAHRLRARHLECSGRNLLDLINDKRVAHGCGEVSGNDQLRVAAEQHAVDIRDHPAHFGPPGTDPPLADIHTGTDGSNGGSRIAAAGYNPLSRWGEIIYWAPGPPGNTEQATIDWWMGSPDHRAQIEDCLFEEVGVGLLYPGGTVDRGGGFRHPLVSILGSRPGPRDVLCIGRPGVQLIRVRRGFLLVREQAPSVLQDPSVIPPPTSMRMP